MYRLPPYHIPRRRITDRCADYPVVIVQAGGGYGKSVLGSELVDSWWAVGIEVQLDNPGVDANLLAARLRAAVHYAGFQDAAAEAMALGDDATGAVDALLNALAKERCAFIFDDAHNAGAGAGALIAHIASRLEGDQRLVVLARELPAGAERLQRAEHFHLSTAELALVPEEIIELCRSGFGLSMTLEAASALAKATGGWTAATVLALARAARTGEAPDAVAASAIAPGHPEGAVAAILGEALANLGRSSARLLAQVARLPLLDSGIVAAATGEEGFFQRGLHAGLPFAPQRDGWWDLPGPVRDHLIDLAPVEPGPMRQAARCYWGRGERSVALHLLLASGDPEEAAAMLASTSPEDAEGMDGLDVQAILDQLPPEVVAAYPRLLMVVAQRHGAEFRYERRAVLVERAMQVAAQTGDVVLARATEAERVNDLCRRFRYDECINAARAVLSQAGPDERYTRARCYYAMARALRWTSGAEPRLDAEGSDSDVGESEECFRRAADLYRALGMRSSLSSVLVDKANYIDFSIGRAAAALAEIDEALDLVVDRPRNWGYVMCFRAKVAADLGFDDECRANVAEVLRVAEQFDSELLRAYGHRRLAVLGSYNGDPEGTLNEVRQAEQHRADNWWSQASATFLHEAADCLSRVGYSALAWEYLERAKAEPKDAAPEIELAEAVLEGRHGDPVMAEERLLTVEKRVREKRELWRVTLMRSFAAFRRGDDERAAALAARSFEEAARLGEPQLPMIRERAVTEQLLALAVRTGEPATLALQASALPMSLSVLGRFVLTEGGRPVPLGAVTEAQLLKFVAVRGRVHSEQAIEMLWPEVGRTAGRNRLRTVLSRLRAATGDVVVRQGEMLVLDEAVRVDLNDFLSEANRARTLASHDLVLATAVARGAMARCQGELLPDDLYEDWAEKARQHVRQVMLDLLDMCATEAARRGDLDTLRRVVERTIEFAPYDDSRYIRAASTLLQQGRRGEALSVVKRARSALAELGIEAPPPLVELERSIVA